MNFEFYFCLFAELQVIVLFVELLPDMRSLAEEYYRKGCERWCIPEVAKIKEQLKVTITFCCFSLY